MHGNVCSVDMDLPEAKWKVFKAVPDQVCVHMTPHPVVSCALNDRLRGVNWCMWLGDVVCETDSPHLILRYILELFCFLASFIQICM